MARRKRSYAFFNVTHHHGLEIDSKPSTLEKILGAIDEESKELSDSICKSSRRMTVDLGQISSSMQV